MNRFKEFEIFFKSRLPRAKDTLFTKIYNKYYMRIIFYLTKIAQLERYHVEDITAEIFIKVYENLESYNPSFRFETWLFTIARNHLYNTYKREKRELKFIDEFECESYNSKGDRVETLEQVEQVKKIIGQQEDIKREVLLLYFFEELKVKEISKIVNKPEGTIKYWIYQLREKVKRLQNEE